jgi:integrase/recombinase XerD
MSRQKATEDNVSVRKYVKVAQKWRFALVAKQSGLIVLDHVLINGRDEYHPEGRYYVEWYERSRRRRCTIPTSPNIEQAARQKLMEIRTASIQAQRLTIGTAVEHYLNFIELHRSHGTWLAYRNGLTMFQECYGKPYIDQVQRQDLLHFMSCCYKRGLSSRTVYGKLATVLQFFRMYGKRCLVQPGDWPKYVEAIRPIYEPEEIEALFSVRRRPAPNSFHIPACVRISRPRIPVSMVARH